MHKRFDQRFCGQEPWLAVIRVEFGDVFHRPSTMRTQELSLFSLYSYHHTPMSLEHTDVGSRSCNSHGCLCQAMRTDPSAACPRAAPPAPPAPWPPRRAPRRPVAFCRPHRGCRPRRGCHRARPARQVCRRRGHLGSGNDRCGGFLSQDIIAGWFISWKIHEIPIKMEDLEVPSFWETSMWWRRFFFGLSSFFPDNMAIKVINLAHFQTAIWHDQQLDFVLNPTISKITLVKDILVPAVLAPKNEKGADFF